MARTGKKAYKILIIAPLIIVVLDQLMCEIVSFGARLGWDPDLASSALALFIILTIFSMTVGLIMTITGTVMAIVKKSRPFVILGALLSVALIVSDACIIDYFVRP
jgi:hypothetical protein